MRCLTETSLEILLQDFYEYVQLIYRSACQIGINSHKNTQVERVYFSIYWQTIGNPFRVIISYVE